MDIHRWWDGDPSETFWMEITQREDLGANLLAPKLDNDGRETWEYALILETRPGDTVFHWHRDGDHEPALVGYSTITGIATDATMQWAPHTRGARDARETVRDSWLVPIADFTPLAAPIDLSGIRRREDQLRRLLLKLKSDHGPPIYYPWNFSDLRPMRTAQAYLAKMPREAVDILLGESPPAPSDDEPSRTTEAIGGQGRQSDPAVRRAVELHAEQVAEDRLSGLGYEVERVGHIKSYDLRARKDGTILCVEVKGSVGALDAVSLTKNEVEIARNAKHTLLVVVDQIIWRRETNGLIATTGGRRREWWGWRADEDRLTATEYHYHLPPSDPAPDSKPPGGLRPDGRY